MRGMLGTHQAEASGAGLLLHNRRVGWDARWLIPPQPSSEPLLNLTVARLSLRHPPTPSGSVSTASRAAALEAMQTHKESES